MAILINGNVTDPQIEPISNGEYEYGAAISDDTEVLFNDPSSAYSHLVAVRKADKLIRFALLDAAPDACVVQGSCIIYPAAFEDTDIYYNVKAGELKEDIMLLTPAAPRTFSFGLESEGVVAQLQADKSIDYFDSLTGERVWSIQSPYAVDAAGADVPVLMDFNESTYTLTVVANGDAAYPIRLDPTIWASGSNATACIGERPIAKDYQGQWYAVFRKKFGPLGVFKSTDLSTWTELTGFAVTGIGVNSQQSPSVTTDNGGNVHMIWAGYDPVFTSTYKVKYAKYNGTTWTTYKNISTLSLDYHETNPTICVDGNGIIHVIFQSMDLNSAGKYFIKYMKSADEGTTWTPWVNICKGSYSQWRPSIAVGKDNVLHVAWHSADALSVNSNQIHYSKSVDSGNTWSASVNVSNIPRIHQSDPSIVVDNHDRPRIFWDGAISEPVTEYSIMYATYDGTAWTGGQLINPTPGYFQRYPSACVDPQGNMHVVFVGKTPTNSAFDSVSYARYDGSSWTPWQVKSNHPDVNVTGAALPARFDYTMPIMYTNYKYGAFSEIIVSEETPSGIVDTVEFDTLRPAAHSDEALMETVRELAIKDSAFLDMKRPIIATANNTSDVFRQLLATENNDMDALRRLVAIDWAEYDTLRELERFLVDVRESYDMSRTLVSDEELLMDTLRRCYSLLGNGTMELSATFTADLMGVLRLRH